jgi:hypothetical protein
MRSLVLDLLDLTVVDRAEVSAAAGAARARAISGMRKALRDMAPLPWKAGLDRGRLTIGNLSG